MEVCVLGSAGSEAPGFNPPAFLIDDFLLLDAGTVSLTLDRVAQCRITHIFLTHAHLDHIKGIPFLVDNLVSMHRTCHIRILSGKEVISDLKTHVFNNRIWPDFTVLPEKENPVMTYEVITTRRPYSIGGYHIHATKVNHAVPAYAYLVEDPSKGALVYTGDTGPTSAIWKKMRGHDVKALIVEVSFPNELIDLANVSGHLTPSLLEGEIRKLARVPEEIYISHLKPQYRLQIESQLARIPGAHLQVLEEGACFRVT
ncbi:MAG: 3',5'-cyclic-nucleotide phosphodiesterase [Desulfobacteraceae bacterium]|nr:3',5'-cyclic-nucleotide phosphodiesterase [Desulfobacteraceae bacterium]